MTQGRFAQFPRDLASRARSVRLAGDIPALLAHPDWSTPAPVVLWLHGRTANKELDPGRYLRWVRAGLAACAIDLPGHGERELAAMQEGSAALDVLDQAVNEIDSIVEALAGPEWNGVFDLERMGIGGMSLGGMATLRRLCDEHPFVCASVEGTTGWLEGLYFPEASGIASVKRWTATQTAERVARADPSRRLSGWRPLPLLALHSESDEMVPWPVQSEFLNRLRGVYRGKGADAGIIEVVTWPTTGAPQEHVGFGRFSNDAKNAQTAFLSRHLRA